LNHKGQALKLYVLKVLNHFNYRNNVYTRTETSAARDLVMLLTYGPLLLLFIIRLLIMKQVRPTSTETLLIVLYIAAAFFYAVFYPRIRYRLSFDFLMIIVVARFLGHLLQSYINRGTAAE
jgi:hypothetical protein